MTSGRPRGCAEKLAYVLRERFGIDSFAAVRSRDEVRGGDRGQPVRGEGEDKFVHTHFLDGQPTRRSSTSWWPITKGAAASGWPLGDRALLRRLRGRRWRAAS